MAKKRGNPKDLTNEIEKILSRPMAPVVDVGRVFYGLGREASNAASDRGEIPTKWIGKRRFTQTAPLRALLDPNGK
jgi:hypothetical protein